MDIKLATLALALTGLLIGCNTPDAGGDGPELLNAGKFDAAGAHVALTSPRFETERDPFIYCEDSSCDLNVFLDVITPVAGGLDIDVEVTDDYGFTTTARAGMTGADFTIPWGRANIHLRAVDPTGLLRRHSGDIEVELFASWNASTMVGGDAGDSCVMGYCGDMICCPDEDAIGCPADCPAFGDAGVDAGDAGDSCDTGYCGDMICCSYEDSVMCPEDCGEPGDAGADGGHDAGTAGCGPTCGDAICCGRWGEDAMTCAADCP